MRGRESIVGDRQYDAHDRNAASMEARAVARGSAAVSITSGARFSAGYGAPGRAVRSLAIPLHHRTPAPLASARYLQLTPSTLQLVRASDVRLEQRRAALVVKRITDIVLSAALLTVSLPLLATAALAIRLTSPGPVLFRQRRIGLNGQEFTMHKLRTMTANAERAEDALADGQSDRVFFKQTSDMRVTPVGSWLRKLSIDEIPQFYDVLRGDMSLVGPRPLLACDWRKFPRDGRRRRATMKPGLTGLWQVSGRSLCSDDERMRLDVEYVDEWALTLDLKILLRTPAVVLTARGAC